MRQTYHRLRKSFWTHSMVPLGDKAQVEAHFGLSDIELILMQDRCTDLEIVLVWCKIGAWFALDI